MNIGHTILVVVATIVGYMLYSNYELARKKAYYEAHDLTKEERIELEKEAAYNKRTLIARLAIWLLCAVFCLIDGGLLAAILTTLFTIDALMYIYVEAHDAKKSRVASLTFLAIPFGALVMAYGMMWTGILGGIILGILTVAMVQIVARVHIPNFEGGEE